MHARSVRTWCTHVVVVHANGLRTHGGIVLSNYWTDRTRRVSRRRLLQATATGGLGLAAAALIGCGGDDDDDTVAATTAPTQAPAGGGAAATATGTAEVVSGKPQGGTMKWRLIGDPPSWSVLRASGTTSALNSPTYDKLLDQRTGPGVGTRATDPFPVLAETMPEVTPDGLEYVYKIHPNVKFQNLPPVNGRALTSEDVKFSIDLYRTTGSFARDFGIVESVEAIDDVTVRVKLSGPWSPLINLSAGHYGWRIVPNEIMKDDIDLTTTIGSGPWIRTEWLQGNRVTYRRNPDYFRGTDGAFLEEMQGLMIPTVSTAAAAFRAGEIDLLLGGLACIEGEELAEQVASTSNITDNPGTSGWFAFNTSKPPFDDVRVRRAVALAYDRQAESQAIYCGEAIVTGLIPLTEALDAKDAATFPESEKWLRLDLTESKALLAAAGFPDGFKSDVSWTPRYGQVYQFAMELMIGQMAQVGIDLEPISYEYGKWIQDIYRGEYDFDGIMWGGGRYYADADPYIAYWLHPDGIANQSRVDDPEMNALIAAQRAELNPEARWEIIHDIQRLEAENMFYVWRTVGISKNFAADWMQDYSLHSGYDLKEFDHIWDKRLA